MDVDVNEMGPDPMTRVVVVVAVCFAGDSSTNALTSACTIPRVGASRLSASTRAAASVSSLRMTAFAAASASSTRMAACFSRAFCAASCASARMEGMSC